MSTKLQTIFRYGKWLMTAACVVYLAFRLDRHILRQVLDSAKLVWWGLALGFALPIILLQAGRWHVLVTSLPGNRDRSFFHSLQVFLGGFSLGIITPGNSGEAGRTFFYPQPQWRAIVAAFLLDKALVIGIIFSGAALACLANVLIPGASRFPYFPTIFISLVLPAAVLLGLRLALAPGRNNILSRPWTRWRPYLPALNLNAWLQVIMITYLHYLCTVIQYYLLFAAFQRLRLAAVIPAAALTMWTVTVFPFTAGQIGVREFALSIFAPAGLDLNTVACVSFSIFLFNFALPAALGCVPLLRNRGWQEQP